MTRDDLVTMLLGVVREQKTRALTLPAELSSAFDVIAERIAIMPGVAALPPSEGSSLKDDVTFAIEARDYFRKDGLTGPIRSTFVMRNSVGDSVLYAVSYAGDVFVRGVVPVRATDTEPAKVVPIWKRLSDRVAVAESEGA